MENELKFNNQKDRVDFDHINEYANLKYLSEFEKRRANNIIVINTNESNLLDNINV
jgi:hypothetical protein